MNEKLGLLVIEGDEDRIDNIRSHLGNDLYSIDFVKDWDNGLDKLLKGDYNGVILCSKLTHMKKKDAAWFLSELERKKPAVLNLPFIISVGSGHDVDSIKEIMEGKNCVFINKDNHDCLYDMEWAIIEFFPKIFCIYKKRIENSVATCEKIGKAIEEIGKKIGAIKEHRKKIESLEDGQTEIRDKYVSWKNIVETLSILVGAFTLVTGIIFSVMMLFFKQSIVVNDFGIKLVPLLVFSGLALAIWGVFPFLLFKKRAQKIVEDRVKRVVGRQIPGILKERKGNSND